MDHPSPQSVVSYLASSSTSSLISLNDALSSSPPQVRGEHIANSANEQTPIALATSSTPTPASTSNTNPSIVNPLFLQRPRTGRHLHSRPRSASLSSVVASANAAQIPPRESSIATMSQPTQLNPLAPATSRMIPQRPGTSSGVQTVSMASSWKSNASTSSSNSIFASPSTARPATSNSLNRILQERSNSFSGASSNFATPERTATQNSSQYIGSSPSPFMTPSVPPVREYVREFYSSTVNKSLPTFDVKVMAREMERSTFGAVGIGGGSGNAPGGGSNSNSDAGQLEEIWQTICVRILPLFNGEGLKVPIEDLNQDVILYTKRALETNSLAVIFADIAELLESGMLTLSSKLHSSLSIMSSTTANMINAISPMITTTGTSPLPSPTSAADYMKHNAAAINVDSDKLLGRLVESWTFFLGTVLPYWEGVFLPLQMEFRHGPTFKALWRDRTLMSIDVAGVKYVSREDLDVRRMGMIAFRDHLVLPMADTLESLLSTVSKGVKLESAPSILTSPTKMSPAPARRVDISIAPLDDDSPAHVYGRLLQMAHILASILSHDEAQQRMDGLLASLKRKKGRAYIIPTSSKRRGTGERQRDGVLILSTPN